jgi:hypothetical protein
MERLERVARIGAWVCTGLAATLGVVAAAVVLVVFGIQNGGWNWLAVAIGELCLLAVVFLAVGCICADRRERREVEEVRQNVEEKLHLVSDRLAEVKRNLGDIE